MSRDYLGRSPIVYIYNLNVSIRYRCFSDSVVVCRIAEEGEHLRLENRSSSESGYQTGAGEWDEVLTDTNSHQTTKHKSLVPNSYQSRIVIKGQK